MTIPKVCPFCGQQPEVFPKNPKKEGTCWAEVRCINQECGNITINDGQKVNDERGSDAYKEAAIRRWNRRFN